LYGLVPPEALPYTALFSAVVPNACPTTPKLIPVPVPEASNQPPILSPVPPPEAIAYTPNFPVAVLEIVELIK